ncbi:hypothetical protein [Streptomyces sp. SID161]|uniref:DUF6924 domain-containing protein n=1 Tax=Streptomyces sp. SID161 TaxID=2690251 RepID=UPI0013709F1E|nr:hypothetical protein [Streptomyces sp. SID161]MYW49205.1 hypothetical protein [Streptomyces sp. SID161]
MISTTGFLALCDSGYEPVRRENLATAGVGPYLIRVHAKDRSSDDKKPRFLIQVIPGERTETAPEPPPSTIEEAAGPLLVRTSFERPEAWARLLQVLEKDPERYESVTVIDNHAYAGFTADQIQMRIGRDDGGRPDSTLVLIADERALASAELTLLAVSNLPDEDDEDNEGDEGDEGDEAFRITLAAAGSFVINMELANTSFSDWNRDIGADGVYREEHY